MILSAEITMYPLKDEYLPAIESVIEKLNTYEDIEIQTSPTSTILMGDYDVVMNAIKETIRFSAEECGKSVFVTKFLPGYSALTGNRPSGLE